MTPAAATISALEFLMKLHYGAKAAAQKEAENRVHIAADYLMDIAAIAQAAIEDIAAQIRKTTPLSRAKQALADAQANSIAAAIKGDKAAHDAALAVEMAASRRLDAYRKALADLQGGA
jgi:hypothetical protein